MRHGQLTAPGVKQPDQSRGRIAVHDTHSLFAAKEAFSKALGTGIYGTFSFQDIEVRGDLRNPTVHLSGRAHEIAEERGITKIHLSVTADEELAAAVVVLETMEEDDERR